MNRWGWVWSGVLWPSAACSQPLRSSFDIKGCRLLWVNRALANRVCQSTEEPGSRHLKKLRVCESRQIMKAALRCLRSLSGRTVINPWKLCLESSSFRTGFFSSHMQPNGHRQTHRQEGEQQGHLLTRTSESYSVLGKCAALKQLVLKWQLHLQILLFLQTVTEG